MMKIVLLLVCLMAVIEGFSATCSYCQATMGLKKVDGRMYCKNHYCVKHKIIVREGKCVKCNLEYLIQSKKGKCHLCDKKDGLVIVKTGWNSWDLFCKDHYCEKHARAFSKYANEVASCVECRLEEQKKARQDAAEKREKEFATQLDKMREEREARQQKKAAEQAHRNKVMAEKLAGIFGKELGNSLPSGLLRTGGMYWSFTPMKKFRNFDKYSLGAKDGKIIEIQAEQVIDDVELAEEEFWAVVNLMDRKYSMERRSKVKEDGGRKDCCYDFECTNGNDPQQRLIVSFSRVPKSYGKYRICIDAYLVGDMKSVIDAEERKDIDAL